MRATYLLAYIALTAFACGGNENTAVDIPSEAIKTTGVTGGTPDKPAALFDMTKEPIVGATTVVAPESGIENEGVVWLEVRTVEAEIDTAWVIVSSGFPEVDVFALKYVMTYNQLRKPFFRDLDNDSLNARIFVRHQL